jgi:hypothetical protein
VFWPPSPERPPARTAEPDASSGEVSSVEETLRAANERVDDEDVTMADEASEPQILPELLAQIKAEIESLPYLRYSPCSRNIHFARRFRRAAR